MALVVGTNCGFVTVAPTEDPAESSGDNIGGRLGGYERIILDTSPANYNLVTEIGVWLATAPGENANWEAAIYSISGGEPASIVSSRSGSNSSGTTSNVWIRASVSIPISPSTSYGIAVQMDTVGTAPANGLTDYKTSGGNWRIKGADIITLSDPWDTAGDVHNTRINAIYALVGTAGGKIPVFMQQYRRRR